MRSKKYNLGKTIRVYIPIEIKEEVIELCRELDKHENPKEILKKVNLIIKYMK